MAKAQLLLIDDEPDICNTVRMGLEMMGDFNVATATDGKEGIRLAKKLQPDLILLDVMMPRMSGFEVCRRIKNDPKTTDIPVIMVTALNELGDIERAINSGTDDFLSKPINKWELVTRVRTMLKLKNLTDKLERTLAYLSEIEEQTQIAKSE